MIRRMHLAKHAGKAGVSAGTRAAGDILLPVFQRVFVNVVQYA